MILWLEMLNLGLLSFFFFLCVYIYILCICPLNSASWMLKNSPTLLLLLILHLGGVKIWTSAHLSWWKVLKFESFTLVPEYYECVLCICPLNSASWMLRKSTPWNLYLVGVKFRVMCVYHGSKWWSLNLLLWFLNNSECVYSFKK